MLDAIIVDDYDDHAELLEYHLRVLGVKVVAKGRNGMEAFLLYKKHNPFFVFLDVNMPVYDGLFALERIRKIDPSVRIVMITGDTSELTKHNLNFLGATEILYKPVDPVRLRDIVDRELHAMHRMNSTMYMNNLS